MKKYNAVSPVGPLSFVLVGALIGSLVCVVGWMMGKVNAFACFPLYGAIGATVLGVVGLSRAENRQAVRNDSQ